MHKIGTFEIQGTFKLTAQELLVATGQIIDGRVKIGSYATLDINEKKFLLKISGVEMGDSAKGAFVGLTFNKNDNPELNLEEVNLKEQIVDILEK